MILPSRRRFLTTASALTAGGFFADPTVARAVSEPYARGEGSRLRLSLAAYSFRQYFRDQRGGKEPPVPESERIGMNDFIDFCAEHDCGAAELTSYFFREDITPAELAEVRHHAHVRGIEVSGTAVGNNFSHPPGEERERQMAYVKQWVDRAVVLGAPHIRVFAGKHPQGVSEEEAERHAITCLEEAGAYAGERGIFLGIENHDSIGTSDRLLRIVRAVRSPWVGVNLDSGNFRAEDPYVEMERSAPYAVNVQLKVELKRLGADKPEHTDLERVAKILRAANYEGYVVLEYEAKENPYEAIPPLLEKLRSLCDH